MSQQTAADRDVAVRLAYASAETLLRTAYSLTHRMHAATDTARKANESRQTHIAIEALSEQRDLREQRDLIDAEIKRRCER